MGLPVVMPRRNTTVLTTPLPLGLISSRSRSRVFSPSGSQISGFLVMGSLGILGIGPVQVTVPDMAPPCCTVMGGESDCAATVPAQNTTNIAIGPMAGNRECFILSYIVTSLAAPADAAGSELGRPARCRYRSG